LGKDARRLAGELIEQRGLADQGKFLQSPEVGVPLGKKSRIFQMAVVGKKARIHNVFLEYRNLFIKL